VTVIPIREGAFDYGKRVADALKERGFRVNLDTQGDMRARIKTAQERKSSYMAIVGDKEAAGDTVSLRRRGSREEERGVTLDAFIARLVEERDSKALPADFVGHRELSAGDSIA